MIAESSEEVFEVFLENFLHLDLRPPTGFTEFVAITIRVKQESNSGENVMKQDGI